MKPLGPYSVRSVIIRPWIFYVSVFFMFISLCLPFFFNVEYVKHVTQLIVWILNVLVFMFLIAMIVKDNIEISKNKEDDIHWFDYFLTLSTFFFFLIYVPMFGNFDKFVEVMSSFVHVM